MTVPNRRDWLTRAALGERWNNTDAPAIYLAHQRGELSLSFVRHEGSCWYEVAEIEAYEAEHGVPVLARVVPLDDDQPRPGEKPWEKRRRLEAASEQDDELLTDPQVAKALGITVETLRERRLIGDRPITNWRSDVERYAGHVKQHERRTA